LDRHGKWRGDDASDGDAHLWDDLGYTGPDAPRTGQGSELSWEYRLGVVIYGARFTLEN